MAGTTMILCSFISPEAGSQKDKQTKKKTKNKYTAKEINTIPL